MEHSQSWKSSRELTEQEFEQILARFNDESYTTGLDTGFNDLNSILGGLQRGQLVLLGGRPAMGKSALMQNIILHVAKKGHGVGVFSLASSAEQFILRLITIESSVSTSKIRTGKIHREIELPKISNACEHLNDLPIYIQDDALTSDDIRKGAHTLKHTQNNIDLIVVDYVDLLQGSHSSLRSSEAISGATRMFKSIAKDLNVCVLVLSQLNRRLERRLDKRPVLSDIRGSSALEQDSDVVCFIYRDEYYNPHDSQKGDAEIIIAKQRNGPTGSIMLQFDGPHLQFRSSAQ